MMIFNCRYPSYCRPNIWPTDSLPELEIGMTECIQWALNVTVSFLIWTFFIFYLESSLCLLISPFLFFVAFKALGKLMMEVGLMLAHHCDRYGMCYGTIRSIAIIQHNFPWKHQLHQKGTLTCEAHLIVIH